MQRHPWRSPFFLGIKFYLLQAALEKLRCHSESDPTL